MKFSLFKIFISLVCVSTQIVPTLKFQLSERSEKLSPQSSLTSSISNEVSNRSILLNLLPERDFFLNIESLEDITAEFPLADYNPNQIVFNENDFIIKPTGNGKAKYRIEIRGSVFTATRYGPFFVFDNKKANNEGERIAAGIDLESKKRAMFQIIGRFLINKSIRIDLDGEILYRAWDLQTQQMVNIVQPINAQASGETNSYYLIQDSIETDPFGNKIYRGVDFGSGEPVKILETGDYLLELNNTLEVGSTPIMGWNKRTQETVQLTQLVGWVDGQLKTYYLTKELGRGGYGVVQKAWDPERKAYVAIKQLLPKVLNQFAPKDRKKVTARFIAEGNIMQQLNHPNVMKVLETGTISDPLAKKAAPPFHVLEYAEGNTLDRIVKFHQPTVEQILEIMIQLGTALRYVHTFELDVYGKMKIKHLDIKPSNVFLTYEGKILVFDFGISQARGTQTSELPEGSPEYMAPEQLKSLSSNDEEFDIEEIVEVIIPESFEEDKIQPLEFEEDTETDHLDYRADIYAMGIVVYVLLFGDDPFPNYTQKNVSPVLVPKLSSENHREYLYKGMLREKKRQGATDLNTLKQKSKLLRVQIQTLEQQKKDTQKKLREFFKIQTQIQSIENLAHLDPRALDQLEKIILRATSFDRRDRHQENELLENLISLKLSLKSKETLPLPEPVDSWDDFMAIAENAMRPFLEDKPETIEEGLLDQLNAAPTKLEPRTLISWLEPEALIQNSASTEGNFDLDFLEDPFSPLEAESEISPFDLDSSFYYVESAL